MRVDVAQSELHVAPGEVVVLSATVTNTSSVIDSVAARLLGVEGATIVPLPPELALFPDTEGTLELRIETTTRLAAGTHPLTLEVVSAVDPEATVRVPVDLVVEPFVAAALRVEPAAASSTAKATFEVVCDNEGNVPVEVTLTAADAERALRFTFEPPIVNAPAGGHATTRLTVTGRRRLAGGEVTRAVEVAGIAAGGRELHATASFTQRPLVPRGALTSALLAVVVAVWALAFLFGMGAILDDDARPKTVPASFFLATVGADAAGDPGGGGAGGAAGESAAPGRGLDAREVGGAISGVVTAVSTGEGVARVTVEVVRDSRNGPQVVSAAATGDDGSYVVGGLFPGPYKLRFTAPGFEELWYPAAASRDVAGDVRVTAVAETAGVDVVVDGEAGSIAGRVDAGGGTEPPVVTVLVRPVVGEVPGGRVLQATTDPTGAFVVGAVPTPGTYELSFSAAGFEPQTVIERVDGGEQLVTNTVRLSAGPGAIAGVVTDGDEPLGGVTVTARSGDVEIVTATPTRGSVGEYVLADLPTPGTYLLTFAKEGFGAETIAVELGPGEVRADLDLALVGGTGTISGAVSGNDGNRLGDVTVTVRGGTTEVVTRTVTAGGVGTYLVSGLPTPGRYTVTFGRDGYTSETREVVLSTSGFATDVDATLQPTLAAIRGTVTGTGGTPLAGVTVTITDGDEPRETSSASQPAGAYAVTGLQPGSYSVTFEHAGYEPRTVLVRLAAGQQAVADVTLSEIDP